MKPIIHTLLVLAALIGTGLSAGRNELLPASASVSGTSFSGRDPAPAVMKRAAPKPVKSVVLDGVEYTAPAEAMGFVVATDQAAKELWRVQIYKITRDPLLEGDVQDVFITKLELDGARLIITDEHHRRFSLDLKTREVTPISKR